MRTIKQWRVACSVAAAAAVLTGVAGVGPPAVAVNGDHGNQMVSANPADHTPHVMNGSVNAIVQVGGKIIAAGTFTSVSPAGTFGNTADDLARNRIFAFDATTGAIDPSFNPNLGGSGNSLDTDGQYVYVGGSFSSVGGNSAVRRVVKLTAGGQVVPQFSAVPSSGVTEVVVRGGRLYVGGAFTSVRSGAQTFPRNGLAALDTTTGAVLADVNLPFAGQYNGGTTTIVRMDANPAGTRLVAVGNFLTVAAQRREQIVLIDTPAGAPASVSSWRTEGFSQARNNCAAIFPTVMRDVDWAPDGSFFAVTTTGAFAGGAASGTLCDTTTRWEGGRTGPGQEPTWAAYTGGDTTYGVAVTGAAIYTGGHMRWQNNPFQGDQAGPGAVPRSGIAALDPVNGLPLSWNPGRARGKGAQALYAPPLNLSPQGLWVGSDTTTIGRETHGRIALMPLAGGGTVPAVAPTSLPTTFFLAGGPPPATSSLLRQAMDAAGAPTGSRTTANTAFDWSTVRGAFYINGTLYYGLADGSMAKRTFTVSTGAVGSQRLVNLYDDPESGARIPFPISSVSGMFYDTATHRLYYTVTGDTRLFFRYFTPESEVVGAQQFVGENGGVDLGVVAGMTLAGGRVFYGSRADGALRSLAFTGGRLSGSPTVVNNDGSWVYRAIFAP